MRSGRLAVLAASLMAAATLGCSGDDITAPKETVEGTLTVDASTAWAYVSLSEQGAVTVADPATSSTWQIGFNATSVALNGGTAGPGTVKGFCLCQNAGATDQAILAMTPESEKADFDGVTATTVSASTFEASASPDVFATAKWYKYNLVGDHRISPTFEVYLIKVNDALYKVQLINYYGSAGETRRITFRYARL